MDINNVMLMQKSGDDMMNSFSDFGIVCTEVPFLPFGEAKDLPSNDWPDEHGEDVYIPNSILFQPFDFDVELACKGDINSNTAAEKMRDFMSYLTTYLNHDGIMVYFPYISDGRVACYKGIDMGDYWQIGNDEFIEFTLKLHVASPDIYVGVNFDDNNNIHSLTKTNM